MSTFVEDEIKNAFEKMGARVKIQEPRTRDNLQFRLDVQSDKKGEFFDLRVPAGTEPEPALAFHNAP